MTEYRTWDVLYEMLADAEEKNKADWTNRYAQEAAARKPKG